MRRMSAGIARRGWSRLLDKSIWIASVLLCILAGTLLQCSVGDPPQCYTDDNCQVGERCIENLCQSTREAGIRDLLTDDGTPYPPFSCTTGTERNCQTQYPGVCSLGAEICNEEGSWEACVAAIKPGNQIERCGSSLDDDCDGKVDAEDSDCQECPPLQTEACTTTLPGVCIPGTRNCTLKEAGVGWEWRACQPAVLPGSRTEVCDNTLDDDCDGKVDATDEDCFACTPDEKMNCATGHPGICNAGQKICNTSSAWDPCLPDIAPGTTTEVCGSDLDEDCNGQTDEEDTHCQDCPAGDKLFCTTNLPGVCSNGQQTCVPLGGKLTWSSCVPLIPAGSQPESCGNTTDDDCDGKLPADDPDCCLDRVKNGYETDVDCGGAICPACTAGAICKIAQDCGGASMGCCNSQCTAINTVQRCGSCTTVCAGEMPCGTPACAGTPLACTFTPKSAGTTCRASTGPCDLQDTCDGSTDTCVDKKTPAGTDSGLCRECDGAGGERMPTDDTSCPANIDCDLKDNYVLTGDNTLMGSSDCTFTNFSDLTSSRCKTLGACKVANSADCTSYTTQKVTAGICQTISGCSGSTPGVVQNTSGGTFAISFTSSLQWTPTVTCVNMCQGRGLAFMAVGFNWFGIPESTSPLIYPSCTREAPGSCTSPCFDSGYGKDSASAWESLKRCEHKDFISSGTRYTYTATYCDCMCP